MALNAKVTIRDLRQKATSGEKFSVLALYDFVFAGLAEQAGVEGIIVGDSVVSQIYGQENTLLGDMDMMVRHTGAVRRGAPNVFLIADMPYMSYQPSVELAVRNAGRFMAEAGADAVKFEGGSVIMDKLEAVMKAGIPVVGHLGYTPQSTAMGGGVKVPRDAQIARRLVEEAVMLDQAGVFVLLLEAVPAIVAKEIVKRVNAPVIGIGSGPACDGQVVLTYELLGLFPGPSPRFVEKFAHLEPVVVEAFTKYKDQIHSGEYPAKKHCYNMKPEQQEAFLKLLADDEESA